MKILPMVNSIEERLRSIRRLRPHLLPLENITVLPWLRSVDSLVRLGVWDRIVQRLVDSGYKDTVKSCIQALQDLRLLEREEMTAVVKGDNYRTIWHSRI